MPHDIWLRLTVGCDCVLDASSWITSVFDTPSAKAVRVADCVVVTTAAVAVNTAVDEPEGTVTAAGTCKELLLLESNTV